MVGATTAARGVGVVVAVGHLRAPEVALEALGVGNRQYRGPGPGRPLDRVAGYEQPAEARSKGGRDWDARPDVHANCPEKAIG